MSDGAYALVDALTCLALLAVLYHRWRYGRGLRKLLRSMEEAEKKKASTSSTAEPPPPSP
jgi:hypothetical protein